MARTVGAKNATVLITGESGTGKEVLARFIWKESRRAGGPFVAINCAALPESLVESELFGHEKGAFTGASGAKRGCFEEAHTGTLFLDEISELRPHVQAKLLRVLQERELRRVGGSHAVPVDVRVVAASSRDMRRSLADESFRLDLYYRLAVIEFTIPPLRSRTGDIGLLTRFFLAKHGPGNGSGLREPSEDVIRLLSTYPWPGNVRELENVVSRATVLSGPADGPLLAPCHLPARFFESAAKEDAEAAPTAAGEPDDRSLDLRSAVDRLKREYAVEALRRTRGNKAEAARLLGVTRRCLYDLIGKKDCAVR